MEQITYVKPNGTEITVNDTLANRAYAEGAGWQPKAERAKPGPKPKAERAKPGPKPKAERAE